MAAQTKPLAPPRGLVARVRRFIVGHALIERDTDLLAAVSGGPDSTCLLLVLAALRRSLRFRLHAAYFDHGLRGARPTRRELRYLRALTGALDVPLITGAGDVRAHARAGGRSIEEAARELRYRFLARAARNAGCAVVAAGHTRDDQAETVLLRLVRGAGLRGIAAMAPSSPWPVRAGPNPPRLIRPLLGLSRDDTQRCCDAAGLAPAHDPSNRSPRYLRNRVRHELLPLLRRFNPRVDDALARLASSAADDVELLEHLATRAAGAQARNGAVRLQRRRLAGLPPALQRHALRRAFAEAAGDARGLGERHIAALLRAAAGPTGAALDLPRGVRATVRRDELVLGAAPLAPPTAPPQGEVDLPLGGSAAFGRWRLEARPPARPPSRLTAPAGEALIDAEACAGGLRIRARRPGDRYQPLGLARPKKLQDILVDAHVPRDERDALPLVCAARGIVWVPGRPPAEWAKVTDATRRAVRLRAARSP